MDLAQLTDGRQDITLAGKPYSVRLLKLREWGDLQGWLKQAVPSPVAEAARALQALKADGEKIEADVRQAILDHAQDAARKWPPRVGSIHWIQALSEAEGGTARFIAVALEAAGHVVAVEEPLRLDADATVDEIADLIRVCLHGEKPLPKATTALKEAGPDLTDTTSSPMTGESCSSASGPTPGGPTETSAS